MLLCPLSIGQNSVILLQKTSKGAERCSLAVCLGEKGDEFGEQLLPWEVY